MKAYKVEVLVLDFENYGPEQIELMLGDVRGLYCSVESIAEAEIGKWTDEHPLNHGETSKAEYQRLFAAPAIAAPVEVERDAARYRWLRQSRDVSKFPRNTPWAVALDPKEGIATSRRASGRLLAWHWSVDCARPKGKAARRAPACQVRGTATRENGMTDTIENREVFVKYWKERHQYSATFQFLDRNGNFCTPEDDPVHENWKTWQAALASQSPKEIPSNKFEVWEKNKGKWICKVSISNAVPKEAMSDAEIEAIFMKTAKIPVPENDYRYGDYAKKSRIAFARAIAAASGPNAALVEFVKLIATSCSEPLNSIVVYKDKQSRIDKMTELRAMARAALAAVGVEP